MTDTEKEISWLRDARKFTGLTITDVAKRLGVSTASVSRWENGKHVSERTLRALAGIYNVDLDALRESLHRQADPKSQCDTADAERHHVVRLDIDVTDCEQLERWAMLCNKAMGLSVGELARVEGYVDALLDFRKDR